MPDEEQVVSKSTCTDKESSSPVATSIFTAMRYLGEICLVILALVSYVSLQKGALKVQLQPLPVPFFFANTSVNDFYRGDISTPFSAVIASDVSLVMYYAPWDFDSQLARAAMDRIALKYKGQVYVAALNCWVQNGDCHQNFSKIRSFPLLLGYVGGNRGIQFRGPLQYTYIDRFVQNLLRPLKRIETVTDFYKLLSQHDAVVTGYFNFTNMKPAGFYPYYTASLQYLEHDVHKTIPFATMTNIDAARKLGINVPPSSPEYFDIRLHLWNETIVFPHNGSREVDVQRLLQWVHLRSHSPVKWLSPIGHKSQLIQDYIIDPKRPSLILFTPRLDHSLSQSSLLVKEAALEYNNCALLPRVSRLIQEIQHQRESLETVRLAVEKQCSIFGSGHLCRPLFNSSITTTTSSTKEEAEEACWSSSRLPRAVHQSTIQGLGCSSNQSLNFYMMDADQYQHFADQLGYSRNQFQLNPNVVFIIDPKDEAHFVLNQRLTRENLADLIGNFSERNLARVRRSISRTAAPCASDRICVREIAVDEFESVVLNETSDVMVFFRKRNCVFCDVAGRFFLRVYHMFDRYPPSKASSWTGAAAAALPSIQFVTIDGEQNDLPWQFTVDKYPTIVFYPAFRKMESRVFPHDMELSVVNLLNFTLSQLNVRKRVTWFIHFCQNVACLQEAQRQISVQTAMIDQKMRSIQHHLLWSDSRNNLPLMAQLRSWMKERRFYRELTYAVLNAISALFRIEGHNLYPDGIRLIEE